MHVSNAAVWLVTHEYAAVELSEPSAAISSLRCRASSESSSYTLSCEGVGCGWVGGIVVMAAVVVVVAMGDQATQSCWRLLWHNSWGC